MADAIPVVQANTPAKKRGTQAASENTPDTNAGVDYKKAGGVKLETHEATRKDN